MRSGEFALRWRNRSVTVPHCIFTAIFSLAVFVSPLNAFSLGPIEIKSGFGEHFNAEIAVKLEDDGDRVAFHIGTREDYEKLELKRLDIVDELEVKPSLEGKGANQIIRVVSSRPLFYPSFNLLIRAEKQDGVILENYLVAVDFQQNVTLSVKGGKKEVATSEEKGETKEAELSSALVTLPPASPETAGGTAPNPPQAPLEKSQKSTSPTPPSNIKEPSKSPAVVARVSAPASQRKAYGPVVQGDSLWRIAEKLGYGEADAMRVAVAIWMGNRDKFINGNIHGIKMNESLNLENLDALMAQVSLSTARETVREQSQEWKRRASGPGQEKPAENKDSPETIPDSAEILLMLEGWRQSWEAGDLDRHMEHFSNRPQLGGAKTPYEVWKASKKQMFDHHSNVKIRIEKPSIALRGTQGVVAFDQHFRSDQMDTFGRKNLEVMREESGWKIANEMFVRLKRGQETPPTSDPRSEILLVLEDWRKSWQEGDFERHMALFSKQPVLKGPEGVKIPYEVWKDLKKRMFNRYKNVEVRLGVPVFKPSGERWTLSCDQTFHSDKMKTFGRKNMEFVREGSSWKIVKEEFAPVTK